MLHKTLGLTLFCILSSACTDVFFQPSAKIYQPPTQFNIVKDNFYFNSKDNTKLHGWYLPARRISNRNILFLHGNGNNISDHIQLVYWLVDYGYNVYLIDYRGYGRSGGKAELKGALADIEAAIGYVVNQVDVSAKIILLGQSLGASMGIYALSRSAYKNRMEAYISISAFSDYRQIVRDVLNRNWLTWGLQWPLSFTINNEYSPLEHISDISPVPVYILHSTDDQFVSLDHADRLFAAAGEPKFQLWLQGGHNNIFADPENRKVLLSVLANIERRGSFKP